MLRRAAEALETETTRPRELGEESRSATWWHVRTAAGAPLTPCLGALDDTAEY